eukprot:UN26241
MTYLIEIKGALLPRSHGSQLCVLLFGASRKRHEGRRSEIFQTHQEKF